MHTCVSSITDASAFHRLARVAWHEQPEKIALPLSTWQVHVCTPSWYDAHHSWHPCMHACTGSSTHNTHWICMEEHNRNSNCLQPLTQPIPSIMLTPTLPPKAPHPNNPTPPHPHPTRGATATTTTTTMLFVATISHLPLQSIAASTPTMRVWGSLFPSQTPPCTWLLHFSSHPPTCACHAASSCIASRTGCTGRLCTCMVQPCLVCFQPASLVMGHAHG
jgi:hypothetical protein